MFQTHWKKFYKESETIRDVRNVLEIWEGLPFEEMYKNVPNKWDSPICSQLSSLTVQDILSKQEFALSKIQ